MKNENSAKKWLLAGIVFALTFLVAMFVLQSIFFPGKFKPLRELATDITGELVSQSESTIAVSKTVEKQNCEQAKIKLKITGKENLEPRKPIDVVFVLDRSRSMDDNGKLTSLKAAAKNFINQMNFSSQNGSPDRVAIVSYSTTARVDYALGSNKNSAFGAIDNLSPEAYTCAGCGLKLANEQMKNNLDNKRLQVVVFLSDGKANCNASGSCADNNTYYNLGAAYAVAEANEIKNELLLPIYSIGYGTGSDIDESTLRAVSSGSDYYFFGGTSDIVEIYNKIIKNITDIAGYEVQVIEVLPSGVDYIEGTFSPKEPDIVSADKKTLTWKLGNLLVDDSEEVSFEVNIDREDFDLSEPIATNKTPDTRVQFYNYDNTAYYTPFPAVSAMIDECPRPAIELKKEVDESEILAGEKVIYSFEVNNTGNTALSQVTLVDNKLGTISCPKTQLASKEKMTCTKETVLNGNTTNIAKVTALDPDQEKVEAEDSASVLVGTRDENLTIIKEVDRNKVAAGEKVKYSYKVKNEGNVAIKELSVEDDKLGKITCPKTQLAPGESMDCTGKEAVIEKETTNTATVSGKSVITNEQLVNTDTAKVAVSSEGISISKSVSSSKVKKGEKVTYSFAVANTGQTKLTDITVVDDKLGTIVCPKSSLEIGEKMTCSHLATINQNTTNVATVTGKNPGGKTVTDKSTSVTVTIEEEKKIIEEKPGKGEIGNLVWFDANCDGIQDKNEVGLEDIRVKAKWYGPNDKRGDRDDVEYRTDTNHNGHYKFENLKDGEYRITVKEEDVVGYTQSYDPDGKLDGETDIEIDDGDGTTKADFGYCKKKVAPATGVSWLMIALIGAVCTGLLMSFLMIKKRRI